MRRQQVIVSAAEGVDLGWLIYAIGVSYTPDGKRHEVHVGQGPHVDGLPMGVFDIRER